MTGQAGFAGAAAGDLFVIPAAGATAIAGNDQVIAAIRQQLDFGQHRRLAPDHAGVRARRYTLAGGRRTGVAAFGGSAGDRHRLLQQWQRSPEFGIAAEAALHRFAQQMAGQRQQRHRLVVRGIGPHDNLALALRQTAWCVVERFVQAKLAQHALRRESAQVAAGQARRHAQRQRGRIRRRHQVVIALALQRSGGQAELAGAVARGRIHGIATG